jgi:hypothetical protein
VVLQQYKAAWHQGFVVRTCGKQQWPQQPVCVQILFAHDTTKWYAAPSGTDIVTPSPADTPVTLLQLLSQMCSQQDETADTKAYRTPLAD